MPDRRPIGVFDSGVGGLTVLRALQQHLPNESTIYLGDLARCPYGTRSHNEVRAFALQVGDYLASQDIKMLVVACNTATAAAFGDLREQLSCPVVGVIEPGAREALRCTSTGRIGVLATDATVHSGAYRDAILAFSPGTSVFERAASWLVPLIERGALAHRAVAERLQPVLNELAAVEVDTLILGCTHFPLVRDVFEMETGNGIKVVDSATTTAHEVRAILTSLGLEAGGPARHRLLVTGPAEAFAERAQAMFHTSPPIETIELALGAVS